MPAAWIRRPPLEPPPMTLFCLPFAGGAAGAFRDWRGALPAGVELCPIHLPGRESRFSEPAIGDIDALMDPLVEGVAPHAGGPYALFGHSMGGLIAFELADRLRRLGRPPAWFFASGARAPHVPQAPPRRHVLSDEELLVEVRNLNGTPPELLAEPELMSLMLPTLRSDFQLVETYRYRPREPLACPVVALGGGDDPDVSLDELTAWREHAAGRFEFHVFAGDHFFIDTCRDELLAMLSERLSGG